jgi:hypothetical protein
MRTFLLMLGSAVGGAVIFAAALYGYFWYQWSKFESGAEVSFPSRSEKTVSVAPPIVETERFHGSTGVYMGDFSPRASQTVLAAGPGRLVGSVTSGGKPLAGLRLRLALNGAVMSQWATSGADGKYEVAVPYATYRVDGYELDSSVVHKVLSGKIEGPRHHAHPQQSVVVAEGKPAQGIDFAFVDPVRKKGPRGDVSAAQPVVFAWEPYPGASAYRIQVIEQKDPADYESHQRVFGWREQPVTEATSMNLAEQGVALKKGYYYTVEVQALDGNKRMLSQSPRGDIRKADFRVVD